MPGLPIKFVPRSEGEGQMGHCGQINDAGLWQAEGLWGSLGAMMNSVFQVGIWRKHALEGAPSRA